MEERELSVIVNPDLDRVVDGVVAFGDFELREGNIGGVVYPDERVALASFYSDLLLGRPMPLTLATRGIHTIGMLVVVALFLRRELVLHPRAATLVWSAEMVDQLKLAGLAHVDRDLARFFKLLSGYMPTSLKRAVQQERLTTTVEWLCEYIEDERYPALPKEPAPPQVLHTGTAGFVAAEAAKGASLDDLWVVLFRQGFLWGALFAQARNDRRGVLAGRKSAYQPLNPSESAKRLNEAESAMGEPPGWEASELWLKSPDKGTLLPIDAVVKVLIHV